VQKGDVLYMISNAPIIMHPF